MTVKYQINVSTLSGSTTATTINIPISMTSQIIGQSDVVERDFVSNEVEEAINEILDYEKTRVSPITKTSNLPINKIIYSVDLLGDKFYGNTNFGFTDDDIKYLRDNFKETFLNLSFYDSDNPLDQRLITYTTLYSTLQPSDLVTQITATDKVIGQPKKANLIPVEFVLENPVFNPRGFSEGFFLYYYKEELKVGQSIDLYMRASFKNAKSGKGVNLMVKPVAKKINELIHELYTKFTITRTNDGYYYFIDDTYQGNGTPSNNNVSYNTSNGNIVKINLYQIQAL